MKLFRDYSPVAVENGPNLCRELQEKIDIGDCRLIDLLDSGDSTGSRPKIFLEQGGVCWTQQYVGLFEYNGERISIGSRFDQPGETFFLRYLLENCWGFPMLLLEDLGSVYADNFFDLLLVTKLAVQLQRAWKKSGLQAYRSFDHNDSQVRGALDIPRHIQANLGQDNGRIAYRTREYSLNNDYNTLFLQACAAAQKQYPYLLRRLEQRMPEFHAALLVLSRNIPNWAGSRRETVLRRTRKKIVNPLYRDYEPARTTARAILRRMGTNPFGQAEQNAAVTGICLDINKLWENYLAKEVLPVRPAVQKGCWILGNLFKCRPDFLWEKEKLVLDAKYRRGWGKVLSDAQKRRESLDAALTDKQDHKKVQDDVYQVLSYMLALNCTQGGVIFPVSGEKAEEEMEPVQIPVINGKKEEDRGFWLIPFFVPGTAEEEKFYNSLKREAKRVYACLREKFFSCGEETAP